MDISSFEMGVYLISVPVILVERDKAPVLLTHTYTVLFVPPNAFPIVSVLTSKVPAIFSGVDFQPFSFCVISTFLQ